MLALPVVVLDNLPDRSSAEAVESAGPEDTPSTSVTTPTTPSTASEPTQAVVVETVRAESTTTTEAPTTTAPPSTTTTTARPTTTTTRPRPTTTTAPPTTAPPTTAPPTTAAPANTESGGATWYRHAAGECAHKTLPLGTVVTVTRQSTGASATCKVTDRGPYTAGRIIDLDVSVFEQLAPLDAGVIQVTITW